MNDRARFVDSLERLYNSTANIANGHAGSKALGLLDVVHRYAAEADAFAKSTDWPTAPMLTRVTRLLAEELENLVLDQRDDVERLSSVPSLIALLRNDLEREPS